MSFESSSSHAEAHQTGQPSSSRLSVSRRQDHPSASSPNDTPTTELRTHSWSQRLLKGTGLLTVLRSSSDVKLILAQRFVRIFAFGLVSLLLAAYLAALGHSQTQIGIFFALTLLGDLVVVLLLTQIADVIGRKTVLTIGAVSMTISGIVFALTDNSWILLAAAIVGVVSPSATEVGPFKSIEESALFTLVDENLVDVLSWYGTAEFSSVAAGLAVSGALMNYFQDRNGWTFVQSCRVIFVLYAAIGILKIILSSYTSSRIESWHDLTPGEQQQQQQQQQQPLHQSEERQARKPIVSETHNGPQDLSTSEADESTPLLQSHVSQLGRSHQVSQPTVDQKPSIMSGFYQSISTGLLNSVFTLEHAEKTLLLKLCALMGVDSCAVGMSSVPWQTYYVRTNFSVSDGALGLIFFSANILGACGTISSNALAHRLGNLVTVAVTYSPAAIIFMLFGIPRELHFMVIVVLAESFFEPIYIAPRNAFIGRIINKKKRTAILGLINMVKIVTNASGSLFTGVVADRNCFWLAFVVAGSLKLTYVLAFLYTFLAVDRKMENENRKKLEEERVASVD